MDEILDFETISPESPTGNGAQSPENLTNFQSKNPRKRNPAAGKKRNNKKSKTVEVQNEEPESVDGITDGTAEPLVQKVTKRPKKKHGRPRGRPSKKVPQAPETLDKDSGALYNFAYQPLVKRGKTLFDYSDSLSCAWLHLFKEEEKTALIRALHDLGSDADPCRIQADYLPSRSVPDITEFLRLLRTNSPKIVLSPGFDLGVGVSAVDVVKCKDVILRASQKEEPAECARISQDIRQAIHDSVGIPDHSDEPVDNNSIDYDRIYRVIAQAFDPTSTVESLRRLCNEHDLGFLMHFMRISDERAAQMAENSANQLPSVLYSRVKDVYGPKIRKENNDPVYFQPAIPAQENGIVAHQIACMPEMNPLRLPPEILVNEPGITGDLSIVDPD